MFPKTTKSETDIQSRITRQPIKKQKKGLSPDDKIAGGNVNQSLEVYSVCSRMEKETEHKKRMDVKTS